MVVPTVNGVGQAKGLLARKKQYDILKACLGRCCLLPSGIFLWGLNGSGKSHVLETVLKELQFDHIAQVSSREIVCGLKPFLRTIVRQLFSAQEEALELLKCDTISDLIQGVRDTAAKAGIKSEPLVVVIEETESLRSSHFEILETLSRLQDLTYLNVCVLYLSTLPWSSYATILDMKPMVQVHFPQYTKEEVAEIILSEAPEAFHPVAYQHLVSVTLQVVFMACRDLRKLQRLVILNYEQFIKPIKHKLGVGDFPMKEIRELYKAIQPKLMQDFRTLKANIIPSNSSIAVTERTKEVQIRNFHRFPELTKYLLIAAYLASNNPASTDKRYFVKSQQAKKRRKIQETFEPDSSSDAQVFSQIRLLAIYSYLTETMEEKSPLLLSQLEMLCDLELVERVGGETVNNGLLDEPKYRCSASYDVIFDIARSLDMDLKIYVHT